MNVVAARDDGALLISEGGRAGVIMSPAGLFATTVNSALSRGEWDHPSAASTVPQEMRQRVSDMLIEVENSLGPPLPDTGLATGSNTNLTAAAEIHTGAMIALVPSDEDVERLVVDGGEEADQLHLTLTYLGEAALIPLEVRELLVDKISDQFSHSPTIVADAFSIGMFNPPDLTAGGREPCVVVGISGKQLEYTRLHAHGIAQDTFGAYGVEYPTQHSPWIPHITLVYTDDADIASFTNRTGPITFDRVRLAFGGDIYDIPLGEMPTASQQDVLPDVDPTNDVTSAFDPKQRRGADGKWISSESDVGVDTNVQSGDVNQDDFKTSSGETDESLRTTVAKNLSSRWTVNDDDLQEIMREDGSLDYFKNKSPKERREGFIKSVLDSWASSSGDPIATAIITSTVDNLGLNYTLNKNEQSTNQFILNNDKMQRVVSSLGRVIYDETQKWFADRNIASVKALRSSRGEKWDATRPYTSWSTDWGGVLHDDNRPVREETIPVSRIFSTPATGFGTLMESELVVLPLDRGMLSSTDAEDADMTAGGLQFTDDGVPIVPNVVIDLAEFAKERDVNIPGGPGHQLREYWVRGPGAAKIRWGTDGSFDRCVRNLSKYVKRPQGLCAEYHKQATGEWPAEKGVPSEGETITAAGKMKKDEGDCPPGHHKMPDGECMPNDEMKDNDAKLVQPARPRTAPWRGVITVEGIESGDGRMFAANSLTWDEPPLPLMWQKETSHGGDNDKSVRVGSIHKIWREPDAQGRTDVYNIYGEGVIDLNNLDGAELYRRMVQGDMRGNSVDVDSIKNANVELVYPEMDSQVAMTPGESPTVMLATAPELTIYHGGRIRATTMVEIPAFTEARLELTDEVLTASGARALIVELRTEKVLSDAMSDVTAAASVIEIPDAPPREWFNEPTDVSATGALTVTPEGRIYGYLAPANVRHRSFVDRTVFAPLKNVDYSRFMGGETIVADGGRVATGAITMDCGHATTEFSLTPGQAKEHYDNSCSIVATARVGENKNGVWIAGALLPDVTASQVQRVMACRLSGDWRAHLDKPGWRELTAALLVPVPGFPMARTAPSMRMEDGVLTASSVPVTFVCADKDKKSKKSYTARERATALVRDMRLKQLRSRVHTMCGTVESEPVLSRDARVAALRARIRTEK